MVPVVVAVEPVSLVPIFNTQMLIRTKFSTCFSARMISALAVRVEDLGACQVAFREDSAVLVALAVHIHL